MARLTALLTALVLVSLLCAGPAVARAVGYVLDPETSFVEFSVAFGPDRIIGTIPIRQSEFRLDLATGADSRVAVELDATGARANFPFASQALIGPKVLDAARHPVIRFESDTVRISGETARVEGKVTIRGQTRPVSLDVTAYRQRGTEPGDLSRLTLLVTGSVRRSDFGATGWMDMVSDEVAIRIVVRISRSE